MLSLMTRVTSKKITKKYPEKETKGESKYTRKKTKCKRGQCGKNSGIQSYKTYRKQIAKCKELVLL